ncbi:hypothetical protein CCP4SC76_7910003 [Gammaproteobacteria bacterium]
MNIVDLDEKSNSAKGVLVTIGTSFRTSGKRRGAGCHLNLPGQGLFSLPRRKWTYWVSSIIHNSPEKA